MVRWSLAFRSRRSLADFGVRVGALPVTLPSSAGGALIAPWATRVAGPGCGGLLLLTAALGGCGGPCASIGAPIGLGVVDDERLTEVSGLAWAGGDRWWAHNDTDEEPALYGLDAEGVVRAVVSMAAVEPVDVEDVALRVEGGQPAELLVGDIGDNDADREQIVLLRLAAPDPEAGDAVASVSRTEWTYEDGVARDAEALLVDPADGAPFVVTQEPDGSAAVFRAEPASSVRQELARVGTIEPFGGEDTRVTAGDVSPDGLRVALRTRTHVAAWELREGEGLADAFARAPCVAPLTEELQGEALAFDHSGFATLSEGSAQTLWWYPWGP